MKRALLFVVVALLCLVAAFGWVRYTSTQATLDRANTALVRAQAASRKASAAHELALAVQRSRLDACRRSNHIHDATIHKLRSQERSKRQHRLLIAEAHLLHVGLRKLAPFTAAGERSTIGLIDTLAPTRNCEKVLGVDH